MIPRTNKEQECIKSSLFPPWDEKFIKYVGEEYQVVKRGRNIFAAGKKIIKRGSNIIFPLILRLLGRSEEKWKGTEISGTISRFKKMGMDMDMSISSDSLLVGKNIKFRELYTPLMKSKPTFWSWE